MPLFLVKNDITKMNVDAIVNAANVSLLGGGGVDGAIHRAAGPMLLEECKTLGGCDVGEAKITKGYELPSKFVIHTVGPIWEGGAFGEDGLLSSCYGKSLALAKDHDCETVAFPLISSGAYGYPKDRALKVAVEAIKSFLKVSDLTVYLVLYGETFGTAPAPLFSEVEKYVEENCVDFIAARIKSRKAPSRRKFDEDVCMPKFCHIPKYDGFIQTNGAFDDEFGELDEGFTEMLFRLIDEKGISDVECYKRANIDRKVFSKIRSTKNYRPSKTTAVAFALALELPWEKAKRLIELAGYSMTRSNKFDVIIEYFIRNGKYDIFEVNEVLFDFDQKLLGY